MEEIIKIKDGTLINTQHITTIDTGVVIMQHEEHLSGRHQNTIIYNVKDISASALEADAECGIKLTLGAKQDAYIISGEAAIKIAEQLGNPVVWEFNKQVELLQKLKEIAKEQ